MTIADNLEEFAGLPVVDFWPEGAPDKPGTVKEFALGEVAWRLRVEPFTDDPLGFAARFDVFFEEVDTTEVTALVIGSWDWPSEADEAQAIVAWLCGRSRQLPALRHLFFGDIRMEESDIAYIGSSDVAPFLIAFPELETLVVRGGAEGFDLTPVPHGNLKTLRIESGGLPENVVRGLAACDLPALRSLELWLGVSGYGGNATLDDLAPLLDGAKLPSLTRLGLMNSEIQDQIATALAGSPLLAQLSELDLSMGTLSDEGAEALLSGQPLTHLKALNLRFHFLSDGMMERFRALLGDVVDVSDEQRGFGGRAAEDRYTEVSE